jgi:uncharacterized protein YfeS
MDALHQAKEWVDRGSAVVVPNDATRVEVAFAQVKIRGKINLKSLATVRPKAIRPFGYSMTRTRKSGASAESKAAVTLADSLITVPASPDTGKPYYFSRFSPLLGTK